MSKSKRRNLNNRDLVFTVGSLLASLGMSLGVIPGQVHALTGDTVAATTPASPESTPGANTGQANLTTPAQQAEYQQEALLRGDGSRSVSAYSKTIKVLTTGLWATGLTPTELTAEVDRRTALLNQGMTLVDLDKADAALQAEAVKRAPAGDATAQAQILLQLKQSQILGYQLSLATTEQGAYDLVLHGLLPNAQNGKSPIDADTNMEIQKRVDMLKSGMTYQQVVDAEVKLDTDLKIQAAKGAPNDPAAAAQIYQQLNHAQLVQDRWQQTPTSEHYQMLLAVVKKESNGALTLVQMETEAVKRMALMNSGMSYSQAVDTQVKKSQMVEYQQEALLRGDGSQSVSAYSKTGKILTSGPWATGLTPAELTNEVGRRTALLNQGMTLADLDKADAALQAEAVKRAPAGDAIAQAQILLQLKQSQILGYQLSLTTTEQGMYNLVFHGLLPNAQVGKQVLNGDQELEIQKRIDMLKAGMTYQQVIDAEVKLDADLKLQAAKGAPNDPAAAAQIYQQLNHAQLVQDRWEQSPASEHYQMLLEVVKKESGGALTLAQMETEAVKRMTLMNSGLSYDQAVNAQVTSAQHAEYQQEALLRGDGRQSVSAYSKTGKSLTSGPWATGLTPAELTNEVGRRTALLNQGMTLTDLDKADAALRAEAVRRAPLGDEAAQAQILLQLKQSQILDYQLSLTTDDQARYNLVFQGLLPNAQIGKQVISADLDMEIQKRVDMLKSGMTYQQVVDAEAKLEADLQMQAALRAPNNPTAAAQIYQQLKHEELGQYLWEHLPPDQHYQFLLEMIAKEPPGNLTPMQLQVEAVKRMALMNSGLSYPEVMVVVEADRVAMLAQLQALAAALIAQQQAQAAAAAATATGTPPVAGGKRIILCP